MGGVTGGVGGLRACLESMRRFCVLCVRIGCALCVRIGCALGVRIGCALCVSLIRIHEEVDISPSSVDCPDDILRVSVRVEVRCRIWGPG